VVKRRPQSDQAHFIGIRGPIHQDDGTGHPRVRYRATAGPGELLVPMVRVGISVQGQHAACTRNHQLDAGSEWANWVTPDLLLREGKIKEAHEAAKKIPSAPRYHRDLMEAALGWRPAAELDRIAQEDATSLAAEDDPEPAYQQRRRAGLCGEEGRCGSHDPDGDRAELLRVVSAGE